MGRQALKSVNEGIPHRFGTMIARETDTQSEACRAFNKSADCRPLVPANDEVTFPVSWDSTILDFGRTVTDVHSSSRCNTYIQAASSKAAICSAGVSQPSDFRGLSLSS